MLGAVLEDLHTSCSAQADRRGNTAALTGSLSAVTDHRGTAVRSASSVVLSRVARLIGAACVFGCGQDRRRGRAALTPLGGMGGVIGVPEASQGLTGAQDMVGLAGERLRGSLSAALDMAHVGLVVPHATGQSQLGQPPASAQPDQLGRERRSTLPHQTIRILHLPLGSTFRQHARAVSGRRGVDACAGLGSQVAVQPDTDHRARVI
ncbi:hypothetical protein M271_00060 [Streptomyces rapamycinicus NRRL 5491]|nr:hypothetical protein M271_00060 [Streptomyces rapamycinicus NRRL 5491]